MRHVQRIVRPNGDVHLYFRKKGCPSHRLKAGWGTVELEAEVEALLKTYAPQKPIAGTIRAAIIEYERADLPGLAESTQYEYRLILKEFYQDLGALPASTITPAFLLKLRDAWATRGHRAANVRLQVLKNVCWRPMVAGLIQGDPFATVGQVRRPADAPEPHPIWPEGVFSTVLDAALEQRRFGLARAISIARYTGARREDIARIPRTARQNGRFSFLSGKRKVPVDIAEDPRLSAILDATPATQPLSEWQRTRTAAKRRTETTAITLAFNMDGRPYTADGLSQELEKLIQALRKAEKIDGADYGFHGLRHTRGVELALAGCTDAEGAAQLGHRSPNSFARYRRMADRVRLGEAASEKVARLQERRSS
ncbi:site-specific integrase [Brevundimonas sp. 2R-24]|uniref:Site-specific integrase n=1 Tax=Peiella sedimenti TaxID=3061083 RepID=A0ABT8SQ52_9CAUL|nr:site-specific integrase [Caulobacteraceae bacterium XZ-24]